MIRNVVMGRLKDGFALSDVEAPLAGIKALNTEGTVDCQVGTDLRLREGGWDWAITSTFVDVAAYRVYDTDDAHIEIRRELGGKSEQVIRVQFEV